MDVKDNDHHSDNEGNAGHPGAKPDYNQDATDQFSKNGQSQRNRSPQSKEAVKIFCVFSEMDEFIPAVDISHDKGGAES